MLYWFLYLACVLSNKHGESGQALAQVAKVDCGISILVDTQKPTACGPIQPAVGGSAA